MKVVALSTSGYPIGPSPMVGRLHCYMKALKESGNDVRVIVTTSDSDSSDGVFDDIKYTKVIIPKVTGHFFKRKKWRNVRNNILETYLRDCDVFYTSEDTIESLNSLIDLTKKMGCKIVIELNEYPYCIPGRFDSRLVFRMKQWVYLNKTLPKVDGVIAISHALYDLAIGRVKDEKKVIRIPILSKTDFVARKAEKADTPYMLHISPSLSEQKDGIKTVFKAFAEANRQMDGKFNFILTSKVAKPSLRKWVDSFIRDNNLSDNVIFTGLVSNEKVDELLDGCSLAVLNKPSNIQNDYNFPTKLTNLLPRAIPVIISDTGEIPYFFEDGRNAFVFHADDEHQLAHRMVYVLKHPAEAEKIGEEGRQLAIKHFYYKNQVEPLNAFIKNLK